MADFHDVIIAGGGHAGGQAAIGLLQRKFSGSIAIVGDDPNPPYERPPLSKEYLLGEKEFPRLLLRPAKFWEERGVTLRLGARIAAVDPDGHRVTLTDGTELGYGALIWAAGGDARRLACPGGDLRAIHSIRTRADVDRLLEELPDTERAVVIGGGYIGLEAAAALRKFGKQVVLLEAQDRVLARVAGEALSRFYEAEHRAHGVDLRTSTMIESIEGEGRVSGVRLSSGEVIPAQMVIVGIGIVPCVAPLIAAGAWGGNGVRVDEFCRTNLPDIFAIGDCAAQASRFAGGAEVRIESVQNANDQAACVAKFLTGTPEPYSALPWFWSNQYDLRLQTVGLSGGHDSAILRGRPEDRAFSVVYARDGRVIALDCVNRPRDFVQGRALVSGGLPVPDGVEDPERPLV